MDEPEPLVSAKAVAARLGMSTTWVARMARTGKLPAVRVGVKIWKFRLKEVVEAASRMGPPRRSQSQAD